MNRGLLSPDGNNNKPKQGDHQSPFGETVRVGATYKDMGEGLLAGAGMIQKQPLPQTLTLAHKRWSYSIGQKVSSRQLSWAEIFLSNYLAGLGISGQSLLLV